MNISPNSLLEQMIINGNHWRVIRLDGNETFTINSILESFKSLGCTVVIVGRETVPKVHYHIVVACPTNIYGSKNRTLIKFVKKTFNVEKTLFSTSSIRNSIRKSIMYSIKDLDYLTFGLDTELVEAIAAQSTKKFKRKEFQLALQQLEDNYYETGSFEAFVHNHIALKVSYGQRPSPGGEDAYYLKHLLKYDESVRNAYGNERISSVYKKCGIEHFSQGGTYQKYEKVVEKNSKEKRNENVIKVDYSLLDYYNEERINKTL